MQEENKKPQKRGARWLNPDNDADVNPGDKSKILKDVMNRSALFVPKIGRPPKYTQEIVLERVKAYFANCYKHDQHPTKTALANALDISFDTLLSWERDPQKPFHDTITRATMCIRDYEETASLEGKMNVILSIFRSKAVWGLVEKTAVELSQPQISPLGEPLTELDRQALIEKYRSVVPELSDDEYQWPSLRNLGAIPEGN